MTGDRVLEQLRSLAQGEHMPSQKAMTQLVLASMAEIMERQETMEQQIKTQGDQVEQSVRAAIGPLAADVKLILNNPAYKAGSFLQRHPRLSALLALGGLLLANVWFVSGWRQPVIRGLLVWLGVPDELVEMVP